MEISSANQAYVFFAMILCGALCTAVFDVFRAVRRYKNSGTGVIAIQDIVFWLIELSIVYMVAFRLNYAKVRAYEIVALVIGSGVYFMTISDWVIRLLVRVIDLVVRTFAYISLPFIKFMCMLKKTCIRLITFVKVKFAFVSRLKKALANKSASFKKRLNDSFKFFKGKKVKNTTIIDSNLQK